MKSYECGSPPKNRAEIAAARSARVETPAGLDGRVAIVSLTGLLFGRVIALHP